jgi:hypothetical protein
MEFADVINPCLTGINKPIRSQMEHFKGFIVDSGCYPHIVGNKEHLINMRTKTSSGVVTLKIGKLNLKNTLYIPDLKVNLFSVQHALKGSQMRNLSNLEKITKIESSHDYIPDTPGP